MNQSNHLSKMIRFELFEHKSKRCLKKKYKFLLFIFTLFIFIILLKPVLIMLGNFLSMPTSNHPCDVLLVEGGSIIFQYVMDEAISVYKNGNEMARIFC